MKIQEWVNKINRRFEFDTNRAGDWSFDEWVEFGLTHPKANVRASFVNSPPIYRVIEARDQFNILDLKWVEHAPQLSQADKREWRWQKPGHDKLNQLVKQGNIMVFREADGRLSLECPLNNKQIVRAIQDDEPAVREAIYKRGGLLARDDSGDVVKALENAFKLEERAWENLSTNNQKNDLDEKNRALKRVWDCLFARQYLNNDMMLSIFRHPEWCHTELNEYGYSCERRLDWLQRQLERNVGWTKQEALELWERQQDVWAHKNTTHGVHLTDWFIEQCIKNEEGVQEKILGDKTEFRQVFIRRFMQKIVSRGDVNKINQATVLNAHQDVLGTYIRSLQSGIAPGATKLGMSQLSQEGLDHIVGRIFGGEPMLMDALLDGGFINPKDLGSQEAFENIQMRFFQEVERCWNEKSAGIESAAQTDWLSAGISWIDKMPMRDLPVEWLNRCVQTEQALEMNFSDECGGCFKHAFTALLGEPAIITSKDWTYRWWLEGGDEVKACILAGRPEQIEQSIRERWVTETCADLNRQNRHASIVSDVIEAIEKRRQHWVHPISKEMCEALDESVQEQGGRDALESMDRLKWYWREQEELANLREGFAIPSKKKNKVL